MINRVELNKKLLFAYELKYNLTNKLNESNKLDIKCGLQYINDLFTIRSTINNNGDIMGCISRKLNDSVILGSSITIPAFTMQNASYTIKLNFII